MVNNYIKFWTLIGQRISHDALYPFDDTNHLEREHVERTAKVYLAVKGRRVSLYYRCLRLPHLPFVVSTIAPFARAEYEYDRPSGLVARIKDNGVYRALDNLSIERIDE